jgi:3-methylcrotonyl-CoA carboxylase alpha subunit
VAELVVTPIGNGAYRVTDGTRSEIAYAAGPPAERWVFLNGQVYVFDLTRRSAAGARRRGDEHALAAPMPATVATITVDAGQRVSKGDVLIVLEAMKMELSIKAPRDGVVSTIACRPGELVQPGVPLLELE